MSNSNSLLAKGYYTEHGTPANVLDGWEARKLSPQEIDEHINSDQVENASSREDLESSYLITRSDTTTLLVKENDIVPNSGGALTIDANGDLIIGKYKVFSGTNLIKGWHAKPSRGKSYNIFKNNGEKIKAKLDEYVDGVGAITLGADGNLHANGRSIKVLKKTREIQLLVYKTQAEGGYNAYLNVIEPGSKANRKDGTKGIFIPAKNGQQASFAERIGENLVTTASFVTDATGKLVSFQTYSVSNILKKEKLNAQRSHILDECQSLAIQPEDHQEFVLLSEQIDGLETTIESLPFSINNGHYLFGLKGRNQYRSYSNGYGR
ncbi:hypothetical protein [Vibrio owensii]|uniref:hypothetical protein n=1 Tax=Vibrio owensii TaxID=696485 RepID=UPI003CC667C3